MGVVIASIICFVVLAAGFGRAVSRLSRQRAALPRDETDALFSPARYQVMERLLAEADQKLVASLGEQKMEKNFRRVRIKIFRGYLRQLSDDFNRVCKAIRVLMVTSDVDRSDLAKVIMEQRYRFALGMMRVEFNLVLFRFGWSGVDASSLIESLDMMRARLLCLVTVAEQAAT
jgi:hypothetical protein